MRLNDDLTVDWAMQYGSSGNTNYQPQFIVELTDGSFFLAGRDISASPAPIFIAKITSTGGVTVAKKLESSSINFEPKDMILTADQKIAIVGNADNDRAFYAKIDLNGNPEACYTYSASGETFRGISVSQAHQ